MTFLVLLFDTTLIICVRLNLNTSLSFFKCEIKRKINTMYNYKISYMYIFIILSYLPQCNLLSDKNFKFILMTWLAVQIRPSGNDQSSYRLWNWNFCQIDCIAEDTARIIKMFSSLTNILKSRFPISMYVSIVK